MGFVTCGTFVTCAIDNALGLTILFTYISEVRMSIEPGKDGILKGAVADDGSMFVKCPLCGGLLPIHVAVNGRPYFYCNDCGLKTFVNYPAGQTRLREILKAGEVRRNE